MLKLASYKNRLKKQSVLLTAVSERVSLPLGTHKQYQLDDIEFCNSHLSQLPYYPWGR
jgi:hypothetical protein